MKLYQWPILSLLISINSVSAQEECDKVQFDYLKNGKTLSKSLYLCALKTERGSSYVSKNCLENNCHELSDLKKIKLKKYPYAVNKSRQVCETLKGVFLEGQLKIGDKVEPRPFCFFQNGSIISSDYLYSKKKSLIITN